MVTPFPKEIFCGIFVKEFAISDKLATDFSPQKHPESLQNTGFLYFSLNAVSNRLATNPQIFCYFKTFMHKKPCKIHAPVERVHAPFSL